MPRVAGLLAALLLSGTAQAKDLVSWNDGAAKQGIVAFVRAVTDRKGPDYVPPAERIAVFDNDGTLWVEQPLYVQAAFLLDQVRQAAPSHPEWQDNLAFQALQAKDAQRIAEIGQKPILELLGQANSGMTVGEYDASIREWLAEARHPKFQRPYTELVYAPMQEVLTYLRAHGFKTFIVSGGSVEFMRPWAEQAYGIPPEQVIGSQQQVKFELRNGRPALVRERGLFFFDDGPGKPEAIYRFLGRWPRVAFGNSDGDLQMLQLTATGEGRRLMLLVRHDDAEREYAYDRQSRIGKLDKALDEAAAKGWIVVSMKKDWKRVFPFEAVK